MLFVVAAFLTSLASVSCSDTLCCIGTAEDEDGHIMFDRLGNTACFKRLTQFRTSIFPEIYMVCE